MRTFLLAALLLAASSSLNSSFAQDQGEPKPPAAAPQTIPAKPDQGSPQRDQRVDRDRSKDDDRMMGRDGMMRRGDGDPMGRDDREMGPNWRMHRDREAGRDRDMDRGRYGDRGTRDDDYADRDGDRRGYSDAVRPRHRVKICVEYDNGDEYCRYQQ